MSLSTIQTALTGQLALSEVNSSGNLAYATGLQIAGALDDLYYYRGRLGVVFHHGEESAWSDWPDDENCAVKIKLWAPTAQSVSLEIFNHAMDTAPSSTIPMHEHNGVWVANGKADWAGKFYLYNVRVWVPADGALDSNVTSDPYSIDLAINGTKSRITDLDSDGTKPQDWDEDRSPTLASVGDLSLYELHIRDFSVNDMTVPQKARGMYDAFTYPQTDGMKHLRDARAQRIEGRAHPAFVPFRERE